MDLPMTLHVFQIDRKSSGTIPSFSCNHYVDNKQSGAEVIKLEFIHLSASRQSLSFILSLRLFSSFKIPGPDFGLISF